MTKKIKFGWEPTSSGGAQCEVAVGSRCLSIGVEPLRDSPWEQAVWMIHTPHRGDARKLDSDLAMTLDDGKAAAEEAARNWLRPKPRLQAVS